MDGEPPAATLSVIETDTEVTVDNGPVQITVSKTSSSRLTIYRDGEWGEYVRDDVVVGAGQQVQLDELVWQPVSHGRTVFQIGEPNRTAVEFRRGAEFRQWGTWRYVAGDFPDGVLYTVGSSTEEDWNYLQFQRIDGVEQAPWRIRFDLGGLPRPGGTATLTVALAAWSLDFARDVPDEPTNLTVHVNDTTLVWTFEPDDSRGATYRSTCAGRYYRQEFRFDAAVLRPTGNEIVLWVNEGGSDALVNTPAYDAIRLELD